MRSSLLKITAAHHTDQEKYQRQMASLKRELTSAIASSKNADDQANSQIEDSKPHFATHQSLITRELTLAKKNLYALHMERDRITAQVSDLTVERDRLVLDIAGWDTDCDRLERNGPG